MYKKILMSLLLMFSVVVAKSSVVELTDKNFESKIKESNKTIVMFSAPWCGACRLMKPDYTKVAESFDGKVKFMSIDIDKQKIAGEKYEVKNIPTTIIFENGKELNRHVGSLDMLDIIEELNPKLEESICNSNDTTNIENCFQIAKLYSYERWTKNADFKALNYFTKVCDNGYAKGCLELGYVYYHAKGVDKNISKALELFDISCKGGQYSGCVSIGITYRDGNGVPQDYKKATDIFKKACNNGSPFGCYHLARSYESGDGIEKNGKKALLLHKTICDNNKAEDYTKHESCNQVGQIYKHAIDVEQNYAEALKYYSIACDRGSSIGCSNLGLMYGNAEGVEKNASRAVKLFTTSCNEDDAKGCFNLGGVYRFGWYGLTKNPTKALNPYRKSCSRGDYEACYYLGDMYKNGIGVDINKSEAMTFFKKGCDGGDSDACDELNTSKSNSKDKTDTFTVEEIIVLAILAILIIFPLVMHYREKRVVLKHVKSGKIKKIPFLYSWTTVIFGWIVPLYRLDFLWFFATLVMAGILKKFGIPILGFIFTHIFFAFFYNKIYINNLLIKGYEPADDESKALLDSENIIYGLSSACEEEKNEFDKI